LSRERERIAREEPSADIALRLQLLWRSAVGVSLAYPSLCAAALELQLPDGSDFVVENAGFGFWS
jgi:hypothetical protein